MEIFRISKKAYAAIDGAGGLYFPGRWHSAGYRVVYAAQSRSLAALESLVHLSKTHLLNNEYLLTTIFIPDNVVQKTVTKKQLPKNWNSIHNLRVSQDIGSAFLTLKEHLILKVPSAIICEEFNFVINPLHPAFQNCKIIDQQVFAFDSRFV